VRRISIILIVPIWWVASLFNNRRVQPIFVINMSLNFREPIFCPWYQLANVPLNNLIRRIKLERLSRPANTVKDPSDFSSLRDKRDDFDFLSAFTK
jgi:hypothetical protein